MNPFPDRNHFSISFPGIPQPVVTIWEEIRIFLLENKCLPTTFEVSQIAGHVENIQSIKYLKCKQEEIAELIITRNLNGFLVNTGHSPKSIAFSLTISNSVEKHTELTCRIEKKAKAPEHWTELLEKILNHQKSIGAWQWRHLYRCWQWANRIDTGYELRFGKLPSGYRKWHETGFTSIDPGKTLIDISKNPGRPKELLPGVRFYPTAEMWLGPDFWQYAKCTKEEASAADFWMETRDEPNYTYFKCWPTAFTRPDGEQGRMQQRLWKLFFHEDCEWPPGSGTICDEPMYGPPELMPDFQNNQTER